MTEPPIDFGALNAEDAPPIVPPDDPIIPDHTASRPKRDRKLGRTRRNDPPADNPTRVRAPRAAKKTPTIPKRRGMFVEPLSKMYAAAGLIVAVRDPICGQAIITNAEECAKTLDELAYQNDAVRRVLFLLVQSSAWGAVITAHLPILLAIAMHHVPAVQNFGGIVGMSFQPNADEDVPDEANPHAA